VQEAGGQFLYRGEAPAAANQPFLSAQPPDLLDARTYASAAAAEYFAALDKELAGEFAAQARPATAHIAVADARAAAAWGEVRLLLLR
jgi:hypothetical protein